VAIRQVPLGFLYLPSNNQRNLYIMKKIYLLFNLVVVSLFAFSGNSSAQITVTSADMPAIGNKFVNDHDTVKTSTSKISVPTMGASMSWNYNFLPTTYQDTDSFVNPSSTPYASSFPSANLADSTYGNAGYNYWNGTGSSFSIEGTVQNIAGATAIIPFSPAVLELNLPAHFGDIGGGTTMATIAPIAITYIIYDSAKGVIHVTYTDTIAGWGTLTTPLWAGQTYNTLCQKHYEYDIDSLWVHNSGTHTWAFFQRQVTKMYQYRWYANGIGNLVGNMTVDSTNKKVQSMQWYAGLPNSINELSKQNNTLVYPNPCTNQVTFRYTQQNAATIFVFDITGREITNAEMKNGAAVINASAYSAGMYLYHIADNSGNVIGNGKFTVVQ